MPISSVVEVQENAEGYVASANGVDVSGGSTVSIRLASTTDVTSWYLQVVGTDELSSAPTFTGVNPSTHLVTSPSTVVTFTFPSARGRALLIRSTVTGIGSDSSKFSIYTRIGDYRVGARGETVEGDSTFGWTSKVNPIIRLVGDGVGGADRDLTPDNGDQGAFVTSIMGALVQDPNEVTPGDLLPVLGYDFQLMERPQGIAKDSDPEEPGFWFTDALAGKRFITKMYFGEVVRKVYIGAPTNEIKVDLDFIYTTSEPSEAVYIVDKKKNRIVGVCNTTDFLFGSTPVGLAINDDDIYVTVTGFGNNGRILKFSRSEALEAYPTPVSPVLTGTLDDNDDIFDILWTGTELFVTTGDYGSPNNRLYKINPTTLAVVSSYTDPSNTMYRMHYAFGSIWVSTAAWVQVKRFNPATFTSGPTATVSSVVPFIAEYMTDDGTSIWVGDSNDGETITKINAGSNTITLSASLAPAGSSTYGLSSEGGLIIAASRHDSNPAGRGERILNTFGGLYQFTYQARGLTWKTATPPSVGPFQASSGDDSTSNSGFTTIGAVSFDPSVIFLGGSTLTRSIKFSALLETTDAAAQCDIRLYNANDLEVVSGTSLSSVSTTEPDFQISGSLTVGAAAGNLKNTRKTYLVQIRRTGGAPTDRVMCKSSRLEISYS